MIIEHIAMYVNDLETARNFFVKYLGGRSNDGYYNKNTGFRSYCISFDDGARLELMNKPELENLKKTLNRTGYAHIAFSLVLMFLISSTITQNSFPRVQVKKRRHSGLCRGFLTCAIRERRQVISLVN